MNIARLNFSHGSHEVGRAGRAGRRMPGFSHLPLKSRPAPPPVPRGVHRQHPGGRGELRDHPAQLPAGGHRFGHEGPGDAHWDPAGGERRGRDGRGLRAGAQLTLPWLCPQGPESEVELTKGSQVLVTVDPAFRTRGDANAVWVDYPNIIRVVPVGGHIYIDDGLISLVVRKIGADAPTCPTLPELWARSRLPRRCHRP